MEKYDAILKTINDKIADCERIIEWYREEKAKAEAIIRELSEKAEQLEKDFCEAQKQAFDYADEARKLTDENEALKKANEALKAENNRLNKF